MKVTEEYIRNAKECYIRCGYALYVLGSWDDEYMFIVGKGEKKWEAYSTDQFFDSFNAGYYLFTRVSAEEALVFVRKNNISEDVKDKT